MELIEAVKNNNIKIVKSLLFCKNIDVNIKHIDGYNALICASHNGHTKIVKSLLLCKVSPERSIAGISFKEKQ